MNDETITQFSAITSASVDQAQRYLQLTDGNLEQAIQLFFEDPSLGSEPSTSTSRPQPAPTSTRNEREVITIDSDDSDIEMLDEAPVRRGHDTSADAEYARQLQEEMYGTGPTQDEDIQAPMTRTRETLVGGAAGYDDLDDAAVSDVIHQRVFGGPNRRNGGPGVFNQRDTQSATWEDESVAQRARHLALATGGASERSSKASTLAELFRPPFDIISRLSFDQARDEGKDELKWIIVNVQDASIFDCQVLNRDLWKNKEVQTLIKEHFIFLQYAKEDPRGANYINYYFQSSLNDSNAYPHIGIVDPRTGEQVKVWSGPPRPEVAEFLGQLYDFLERYSLDDDAKNPVAKRKPEPRKEIDIDRMTEEQMLEMALQNSMAGGEDNQTSGPAHIDPDELTKSIILDKGKGKEPESQSNGAAVPAPSIFESIRSDKPHTEPANDPASTTRIQFRYSGGRLIRRFSLSDAVSRIYEWLKAEPLEGKAGKEFELLFLGKNLIERLDDSILEAGLKNGSVMVEFTGGEDD